MHDVQRSYDEPFVQLPSDDLHHIMQHCKPTTVNVYLALQIRSNRKRGNTCFPSYQTIADDAGVSRRTAITALDELQAHGFVTVETRMNEEGDQTSNMYWIHRRSAKLAQGSENIAPPLVQNLHHPVVQNLHPNHKNLTEPEEGEPYVVAPKRKKQTATTLPDEWHPNDDTLDWMTANKFVYEDLERELPKFKDHHAAKGNRFVNWDLAFKNWLRNSKEWGHTTNGNGQRPAPRYYEKDGSYTAEGALARMRGEIE